MPDALPATISSQIEHEIVVRKSRFIAHLAPVESMAAADAFIAVIRKKYWNANHNCVAIIVGPTADEQRSSDDGEPSGTAGVPMLEVLRNRKVTDIVAVVTRYFGGILLGTGGLIRAYSSVTAEALDQAAATGLIRQRHILTEISFDVPHADAGRIEYFIRDWIANRNATLAPVDYAEVAHFTVFVPPTQISELQTDIAAISAGAIIPNIGAEQIVDLLT